ncbi:Fe2+-enterobactin ABC transporter substrate-binding protein [Micromonospora polyrhachis]|uniref:Iron complex transport system substrate-binding protein n=1 Tax=Micromonospora polyrhachis TaxID=1282883 RepID=A0A7W7SK75_9ACTN|nr:Fe2+-enterobactin ABC transporter substrate-binding protein [Micromonospora polyrhachis]MBB4956320.1 iron complex transport system substrate-binding protein [Micromonospora polyrhachis]
MSHTLSARTRTLAGIAVAAIGALTMVGCADSADTAATSQDTTTTATAGWPRTFKNADGTTTEIPKKPAAIVSTSVSVSGTLLAFDAPVVASGSAGNGKFFAQWANVATERNVANLWPAGKVELEAVYAHKPDLIVVSSSGADSVTDQLGELRAIAPTIVVDYGGQTWQELAAKLGEATGREAEAKKTVTAFDDYVRTAAAKITVPSGAVNIVSYNGAGEDNPIARVGSAQGRLLTDLGFTVEDPNTAWHTQAKLREDFVFTAYENLTKLTADTTFILSKDDAGAQAFAKDPVLANLPSVKKSQVHGLGLNSFRMDKYSATEIVDGVVANFAK